MTSSIILESKFKFLTRDDADDVSLILDLIEAVLGSPPQDSTTTTTTAATNEVILELLEDETLKESIENDAAALQKLHVLCWNTACRLLENGSPSEAAQFHTAAASFLRSSSSSSGGDGNDDVDGKVQACMALALCSTATKNFSEALQYLEQAEQIAPGRLAVAFLRVKTCLAADDESAAAAALQALAASPECDADALRVACCEALECGKPAAAKAALEHLLHKIQDSTAEDASLPAGYESVVLQNLLQIILSDSAADAVSKSIEAAHWFEVGVQRLTTVGLEHYFQNEVSCCVFLQCFLFLCCQSNGVLFTQFNVLFIGWNVEATGVVAKDSLERRLCGSICPWKFGSSCIFAVSMW